MLSWFKSKPDLTAAYAAAVARARTPALYRDWGVADTLDGRFDAVALHVFLLMRRLKAAPEGVILARSLAEVMIADMDRSLREMGVGDMTVGRKVRDMAEALYGRIGAYDAAFEDRTALAVALDRNLYGGEPGSERDAAVIAAYMLASAAALDAQDVGEILRGDARFAALPPKEAFP